MNSYMTYIHYAGSSSSISPFLIFLLAPLVFVGQSVIICPCFVFVYSCTSGTMSIGFFFWCRLKVNHPVEY